MRLIGRSLLAASLLLLGLTVWCFATLPDHFAAFTLLPIWIWGGGGLLLSLLGCYILRGRWSWLMSAAWALTLLGGADEASVLGHLGTAPPLPGPAAPSNGKAVIRVITMNCAIFALGDPLPDLAAWAPDIVLLQDAYPDRVRRIAEALYGGTGSSCANVSNGIVTRWKIQRDVPHPTARDQQATIVLPDGSAVEVVNVHLASAATDLRFWRRATWCDHRINRALRLQELATVEQVLARTSGFPNAPTLFGGDFNSAASDIVHRQLARDFVDAFTAAGTGGGDTYPRRLPILRIDPLYATRHFTPVRCHTVTTRHSDHRMVVADFVLNQEPGLIPRNR